MIKKARITGKVEYREGDGANITIRPGPCEVDENALDATDAFALYVDTAELAGVPDDVQQATAAAAQAQSGGTPVDQDALKQLLEAHFVRQGVQHWLDLFGPAGVPCAPINGYAEALADPQVQARGMVLDMAGGVPGMATPIRFSDGELAPARRSPQLGEG